MLSPDFRSKAREEFTIKRISTLARNWTVTETEILRKELENREYNGQELVPDVPTCYEEFDGQRLVRNFKLLCWRAFTEQMREVPTLVIKVTITTLVALIVGGIFQNLSYDQASVGNRVGLLFVISINQGFNAVSGVLNVFPKEKVIVNRERAANAYDTLSYFVAKYLVELPINIMPCVIFGSIVYWMVGLNPDRFGYFILILMLEAVTAVSLGLAVSAAAPNVELAQALGPLPIILSLIFGGFFINLASLPLLAEFLPYLSFLKWVFQSLAINEFTDVTFECNLEPKTMCSNTGAEVLQRLTFTDTLGESVFGLAMVFLGFTVLAFILLERNFTTYIELGYVGSKFDKNAHVKYAAE
jgi:ABC-type multidrug transport system permease subunit